MDETMNQVLDRMDHTPRTSVGVEITVTNACNRRCSYCFESSHDNISSRDEELRQLDIIKRYCEAFDLSKHDRLKLTFWGGEPMMNTRFLFELIRGTSQYEFVDYMMYSNGTLIEGFQELLKQDFFPLVKDRIEIQLSYDGEPHHTNKRGYGGDLVVRTAQFLVDNGVRVSFKATLALDSIHLLPQIWDSYKELYDRFDFVHYSPTLDQTNADNTDEAFATWKKAVVEIAKKEKNFIKEHGRPLCLWFSAPGKLVCSLNDTIHMHCDGKLYICHGCQYQNCSDAFSVGKTSDVKNLEDFLSKDFRPSLRLAQCVDCSAPICAVCHVSELSKNEEDAANYKERWTSVMVNNGNRCRFFKYFAKVYHALKLSLLKQD